MSLASQATHISKARLWAGRIISSILVLFLLFDAIAKILRIPQVLQAFTQLGWAQTLAISLALVLLTCTLIYAIPYTSALPVSPSEPVGIYGWDGGLGTSWRANPTNDLTGILLTQRAWTSARPPKVCTDFWSTVNESIND